MTKYKIVAGINIFLGFFELFLPLILILLTIPRLSELYAQLKVKSPNFGFSYSALSLLILMGMANFLVGVKLLRKSVNKNSYFKYAIILIVSSFILGVYLIYLVSFSLLAPIYNLSNNVY